ncbi:MAG TPA: rhodanese-like domain-containing protein [Steroidobacteraceae bacterium]|nr:rhodanese-like domain-containing protein [Steroidobacteraceae bacterium]
MSLAKRLGASAFALGLAAPFAGSPYLSARGHIDVDYLARIIAQGEDHIEPRHLAHWIRDRTPRLRVIDVRRPDEFAEYAIPTAENIPLDRLPRASFASDETIVLYSEGGAHGAQAWMMLRAMGHSRVYFISGGLVDWYHDIMRPTLAPNATDEQRVAFENAADLSRYFGGVPQLATTDGDVELRVAGGKIPRIATLRRRGC